MEFRKQDIDWSMLLHDIRSVQNVASIFRLAEVFGVNTIYLSGITPGPLNRFGFERPDFLKISLGTEKRVRWIRIEKDVLEFIENFKNSKTEEKFGIESAEAACQGILKDEVTNFSSVKNSMVIGLEQSEKSVDYKQILIPGGVGTRYLLIPGREVEGLDENILRLCDIVAEIPQYGDKESLNVFSATSIAVARFFDQ
jgi:tRNA G18 (ribose-2'-O)-methylase SpoU